MAKTQLTRSDVINHSETLKSFPATVAEILATVDDPDGNFKVLVDAINHDPIIAARVLSVANSASARARRDSEVTDIYTATSLIGMSRVRQITLISSLGTFVGGLLTDQKSARLWQHSVAVGVCCEELALHVPQRLSVDIALIAGLLHDIGQFWFYSHDAAAYEQCRREALERNVDIEVIEQAHFGVGHSMVGAWLAEYWCLPASICAAIACHHQPDAALSDPLVPLVHVAEVLSNALELSGGDENRVTYVSDAACKKLGLVWNDEIRPLFGRIEARSRHANAFFQLHE
jgi:HD-like signal output (HDOD) protein